MMAADSSKFSLSVSGAGSKLTPLTFNLVEGIYSDDLLTVSFQAPSSSPDSLIGKDVNFSFEYGGKKESFNGIVINCSKEQSEGGTAIATIQAKTLRHLLDKEKKSAVYCKTDVEEIAKSILGKAGISTGKCSLAKYETEFKVQYNESDLAFLQRLFREHSEEQSIIEFVQHSGGASELVISDSGDFSASSSSFAKSRLEATETGNVFYGYSHDAPLRPGMAVDAFGETFIVYSVAHAGSQEAALGINGKAHGYSCQIAAFSKQKLKSFIYQKEKPQVPGVIVATVESPGDAAHLDSQGRYIIHMPFDDENKGTNSSAPVHLAQSFAGKAGSGVHFPLHKDTPVLVAFEDGDIDKPIALSALPKDLCTGPVNDGNSSKNILKTAGDMEIVLDDEAKSLSMETPNGISANAGKELSLKTEKDTSLCMKEEKGSIDIDASKKVSLKSGDELILEGKNITIKAGSDLVLKGATVKIN